VLGAEFSAVLDQARDGDGAATDTFLLSACRAYLEGRVSPTGSRAAASAYRSLVARAGGAANVAAFCQGVVRSAGP
jgi:hypothetical protein